MKIGNKGTDEQRELRAHYTQLGYKNFSIVNSNKKINKIINN